MNNLAFQIYGLKKNVFQSTWDTTITTVGTIEYSNNPAYGTNWTTSINLNTTASTHTVGFTNELVSTRNAVAMQIYQIVCTVTGTTGSIQVKFGNTTSVAIYPGTTTITLMALTTDFLRVIPTSDFDGTVRVSVKDSSSASNQVKLPLPNLGTYNIWVDWGDGTSDNITSYDSIKTLHTYPVGITTPTIRISGNIFNLNFNTFPTGDRLKIKTVSSWGKLKLGASSFNGCSNVTMSGITDVPDLTGVTSLNSIFAYCSLITTIGRLNEWNTSSVTSTSATFYSCSNFNQNIGAWNLTNCTDISTMLAYCTVFNNGGSSDINNWRFKTTGNIDAYGVLRNMPAFNQPVNNWNTERFTRISTMFYSSTLFNQNLNNWNLSNCNSATEVFQYATSFNNGFASGDGVGNQLTWNTSACTTMWAMFSGATAFNSNLGTGTTPWNVSNVTSFLAMFSGATRFNNGSNTADINNWSINTLSNVTMDTMFNQASIFNRDISGWNVSKVTNFTSIFRYAIAYNNGDNLNTNPITSIQGLDGWNINTTSSVTMYGMFLFTNIFNRPLASWNMTRVNNTNLMFRDALKFNQPLSNWERAGSTLANVTNMSGMFCNAYEFNQSIGNWNVSSVVKFGDAGDGGMFSNAYAFNNGDDTYPLSNWSINSVSSVTMAYMFSSLSTSVFNRDISTWNMTKVNNTSAMFSGAYAFDQPLVNWERAGSTMGNVTTMFYMFNSARIFNQPIGNWNTSSCTDMGVMFNNARLFNQNINNWNVGKVKSFAYMFTNAFVYNQPMDLWSIGSDASVTTIDMSYMFRYNNIFNQDISTWNVNKVTNFTSMFENVLAFNNGDNLNTNPVTLRTGIDGWNINTASDVNMSGMFIMWGGVSVFDRPIANWNVSKVFNMSAMFAYGRFTQDISSWNVSYVKDMSSMFLGAISFNQSLSNWERTTVGNVSTLANVTNMNEMFSSATSFNNGLGSGVSGTLTWNTSSVKYMYGMFRTASKFNQNINNWNVSKVEAMNQMFQSATLFNQPLDSWVTSSCTNMSQMFYVAPAFRQNIGSWDVSKVTLFTNFMLDKTPTTFPSPYLDNIYNGWSTQTLQHTTPISITFGAAKYSQAGKSGKDTLLGSPNNWTIADGLLTVSGTSNNGGLIRVTTSAAHGFTTGNSVYIYGVNGTTNANGTWVVTLISTTIIELQGSTYNAAWTSGGNVILG